MSPTMIGILFGVSAGLLTFGLFRNNRKSPGRIQRRMEMLGQSEKPEVMDGSFYERVLDPAIKGLVDTLSRILPTRVLASVAARIEQAGNPITLSRFMALWAITAVLFAALGAPLLISLLPGIFLLAILPLWTAVGIYIPWWLLRRKAQARIKRLDRALPDAMDLIVTAVESGLGLQAAMLKVTEHFEGPIAEEFSRASHETSLGRARSEALHAMGERCGSRELRLFVRAVNEAEQMGISVSRVLRNQSAEVRERRRQRARELANTIPVKITIPTVLFIFPTLFLVILGPVALQMLDAFSER